MKENQTYSNFIKEYPAYSEFIKEIGFSSGYTDNALASVESRAKVMPKKTPINRINLGLGYKRNYGKRSFFYSIYRFNLAHYPDTDYLRLRKHSLFTQFNNNLSKTSTINLSSQIDYFDFYNNPFVTYSFIKLDLFLKQYLNYGLIFEGNYYFTSTNFRNQSTNSFSYGAISNRSNNFSAKLKFWHTSSLRYSLQSMTSRVFFNTSSSKELRWRSGLDFVQHRSDIYEALTAEITYLPIEELLFNIGYLFEYNISNAHYYRFRASSVIFDAMWFPDSRHQIILETRSGFFDFFDRTFDDRYLNTKYDTRLYLSVTYNYRITENVKLTIDYNTISNNSNDSLIDFSLGHTKSYSSFTKNDIMTDFKYTF